MMTNLPHSIDPDGMITDGPFDGFYVLPLAIASRDSSHDFPSFVEMIGLSYAWDIEPPMHPTRDDAAKIADAIPLFNDERDDFIDEFPLDWDT